MKILKCAIPFAAAVLAFTACTPKDPHSDSTASKGDGNYWAVTVGIRMPL